VERGVHLVRHATGRAGAAFPYTTAHRRYVAVAKRNRLARNAAEPLGGPAPLGGRVLQVMDLLVRRYGYPVNGAAGLVGNLIAESEVLPNRIEGSAIGTPMRAPTSPAAGATSPPSR
jgi:hypothetical protein